MTLSLLPFEVAVCRLSPDDQIPAWVAKSRFLSVTRSDEELSIVVESILVPEGVQGIRGWGVLKLHGPVDFSETGVIHALTGPAAREGVGVFAISTYDTDYLLAKREDIVHLVTALRREGFTVVE